jgi:predicted dinucleotide-binding enzyme
MKIGVLGSGVVGQTLGAGFLKHGHQVMLGTRDPQKPDVQKWVSANPGAKAGTFEEVAKFGEFLVLATAGPVAEHVLQLAGPTNLAGKPIMDACNPTREGEAPQQGVLPFYTGPNDSLAERLQAKFPDAHLVKAFNSVGVARMVDPHFEQGTPTTAARIQPRKPPSPRSSPTSAGSPSIAEASSPHAHSSPWRSSGAFPASCATSGRTPSRS